MKSTRLAWLLLSVVGLGSFGGRAEVTVEAGTLHSNVFAGREVVRRFSIRSSERFEGRLAWRLAMNGSTLARREQAVVAGPGQDDLAEIRLALPEGKPGVVLSLALTVTVLDGAGRSVAVHEQALRLFPEDAFAGRREVWRAWNIRLFDPKDLTAEVLSEAELPFDRVASVDAFDGIQDGVLVIGEGVSPRDYRGLWAALTQTAARGVPVLCLALAEGEFEAPTGQAGAEPRPVRLAFRRNDMISDLDKRLDIDYWPPDGRSIASSIELAGERGAITARVRPDGAGWPWLELAFAVPDVGKAATVPLIVCGFSMMNSWNDSPTPRYLFVEMLRYLAEGKRQPTNRRTEP